MANKKPKFKAPEGLPDGIYFNLSNEEYHADKAFSHSGMVDILHSDMDYWINSPLNPNRMKNKQTDSMEFGDQAHMLLFDEKRFWNIYNVATMPYKAGKKVVTRLEYEKLQRVVFELKEQPDVAQYFQHGYPEVSVFWTDKETGIRLRVRFDYLRTFGAIDYKLLKSIGDNTLAWALVDYGFDIQESLYREAIYQIRLLLRAGKAVVVGDVDPEWLKAFVNDNDCMFEFIYQRNIEPFIFKIKHMDNEINSLAKSFCDTAKRLYKEMIAKYGEGKPPGGSAIPEEFSMFHIPKKIYDRRM